MLRRTAHSAALAALTVLAVLLPAGPTSATDRDTDPTTQTQTRKAARPLVTRERGVARRGKRAETQTPLSVTIDQLTPSTIPDRGAVRVSGWVTNNDTVAWSAVNVYAFVSDEPMTSAAQLEEAAATESDAFVGNRITDGGHHDNIPELAPGDSAAYSFRVPRRLLQAASPGVYWFGVHALGESVEGRDTLADGRARTFLPLVPPAREGRLPAAVVIPLRRQLVYTEDGSLDSLAGWSATLSPGGRLRSLVEFGATAGDRPVTWVVDPALVDAVRRLAAGNPPRSLAANLEAGQDDGEDEGVEDPSAPASAEELPTVSPGPTEVPASEDSASPLDLDELDPVVQATAEAAQAWLDRLSEAMRGEDQVLTLPYGDVDVAAAGRHAPELVQRAAARSGGTLPGFDGATTPVVSSPSGFLNAEGLAATDTGSTVLLTDAMFERPAPSAATLGDHQVVVTSTGAAAGGPGPDDRTAATAMRQRLLSEAAVRFLRGARTPVPLPVTMMVPHDWNPSSPAGFFSGLDVDWLELTTVGGVEDATVHEQVDPDTLRYPAAQAEAELDAASFESAIGLIRTGAALQNLLTLNNVVSGTVTDEALGSVSYGARSRPLAGRVAVDRSQAWIEERLRRVSVTAPQAVTLSSSSGRFAATVTNGLDQPVTVSLDAQSDERLTIAGPRRVEVPANSRATVLLTARTDENGIHEVTLLVTDKRGTPLGSSTVLSVRSAQVSNVIWLFLGIGAALLFSAIGLRLFRRVRNARRAPVDADQDGDEDGDEGPGASPAQDEDKQPAEAGSR